jgi:acetyl-CoA synthetase
MKQEQKLVRKGDLYYPTREFKNKALVNDEKIYKKALRNPKKFWADLAKELIWFKKWRKVFSHKPPYFQWFVGGKINITVNALDRHLEQRKNKVAMIWEPEPLEERPRIFTYYDLYREVNKFANALKSIGVKRGDRVGIYLPMIPEAVIAMLACARIGAVHSVVFSAFSSKALKVRLQDTKAKVLITSDGYYRKGEIVDLKKQADEGIKRTDIEKVIVVQRAKNKINFKKGKDIWWHELIAGRKDFAEPAVMDAEDLLFILYTSGSTGKPKGCMHVEGGYAVQANFTAKWIFDLKDDDIFWSTADLGWITGHTYSCYGPLLAGATFILFEGLPTWPAPDRWADIIDKYGVTTFYTAPTAVRMFEKYGTKLLEDNKFDALQIIGSVGEPIDEAAWKWYFKEIGKNKRPLLDTWWQTETGGILITSLPGIGPFKPTFTGRPFPGLRFEILDDKGRKLGPDKEGNLVLKPPFNPGLLRGVYKNPEKYLKTYWTDFGKKIYFTSDRAYKDRMGLIRVVGRADDAMKVAGHRLTTGEMESAIALHKDITECAVVGVSDEIKGEVPIAFVTSKNKKPLGQIEKDVVAQLRSQIGPIATPKKVYLVKDLPKTRSGKIMRRILRKLFTGEDLGDLSTLANPESVEQIRKIVKSK